MTHAHPLEEQLVLSDPPADRDAAVQAVEQGVSWAAAEDEVSFSDPPEDRAAAVQVVGQGYAQAADEEVTLSDPPDDRAAAVQVVEQGFARAAASNGELRFSDPPADRGAAVQVVEQGFARAAASNGTVEFSQPPEDREAAVQVVEQGVAFEASNGELRFSDPPADRDAAVEAVEQGVSWAAAEDEVSFSDPPEDRTVAVEVVEQGYGWQQAAPAGDGVPATAPDAAVAIPIDNQEIYRIIRLVAAPHSGKEMYASIDTSDAANGLAFGLVHVTQASGLLGATLQAMHRRDPVAFSATFGPDSAALLATTNAATPSERLATVSGQALTTPTWTERFRKAGTIEPFQHAQNEIAIERLFRPFLKRAFAHGLDTDRALALVFETVLTKGLEAGVAWVEQIVGTEALSTGARMDRLVAAAEGSFQIRLQHLRTSTALDDLRYSLS